ncbi:reverse transcriptase domain-containing protein [Tanacetum coccineum]
MSTMNQGMSFAEIEQIVAQRVANAIETITIYEATRGTTRGQAHTVGPSSKKGYAGNLPLCNKCKFYHTGPCVAKCGNCKRVGHQTKDCRAPVPATTPKPSVAKRKAEVTCYECGRLGYYKSDCLIWKCQDRVNKYWKEKARENSSAVTDNANA